MANAAKIVELADKHGIAGDDRESLVAFALGYSDGVRNADSTEPVHLFGATVSPNVLPIWFLLEAAQIPYVYHEVDLMKGAHLAPEYVAMNSYHTVPTIKHGDFCLHEHASILRYLARTFPTKAGKFYGNSNTQKQAVIECAMDERVGRLGGLLGALFVAVAGFGPKPDEEQRNKQIAAMDTALTNFANHFLKSSTFVGGDHPSIADLSLASIALAVLSTPFAENVPQRLREWATALVAAVPAIGKVIDGETNGQGFGAKQFLAMRAATYDACEVGKFNGQ